MRIALVECKSVGYLNIYALIKMPRGIPLLAAILQKSGHEVTCFVESIQRFDWRELLNYDLIGFGIISCTANPTYDMIKKLRSAGYVKTIIVGGPHATALPDESLDAGANIVVRHEGDKTLPQLVDAIQQRNSFASILGITWQGEKMKVHNADQEFLTEEELSVLPLPAYDTIVGYEKMLQFALNMSRGCPYSCTFCAVGAMFGSKYRSPSLEWRVGQIVQLHEKYPILWQKAIGFFSDDNFYGNAQTKLIVIQMLEQIISLGLILPRGWLCQARVTDIDQKTAELMEKAGSDTVCLGLESADAITLKAMHKGQTPEQIRDGLACLHNAGIKTLAMTIAGTDTYTFWSFFRGIRQFWRWGITYLQILAIVPLDGTKMTAQFQKENRKYNKNYNLRDGQHVLMKPKRTTKFSVWLALYGITFWFYLLTKHGRGLIREHFGSFGHIMWIIAKHCLAWPIRAFKGYFVR